MNTQRFGLPVIIAAGLHGALFLIMPETTAVDITPPRKVRTVWLDRIPDPAPVEPDADAGPAAMSRCRPALPVSVDLPGELRGDEPFTVPIESYRFSADRVHTLPGDIGPPPGIDNGPGGPEWRGLPDAGHLDRVPRATAQPAPVYPEAARREGAGGTVIVEFVVGTSGEVVKADAVRWTRREFVEPAVRAVWRWRFEPGTIGGRKVRFRMAVPIEFNATP